MQLAAEAAAAAGEGGEDAIAAAAAAAADTDAGPSKRRRTAVDYSALNAQLEKEGNGNAGADTPMDGTDAAVEEDEEDAEDEDAEEGEEEEEEEEEEGEEDEEDDDVGVLEMDDWNQAPRFASAFLPTHCFEMNKPKLLFVWSYFTVRGAFVFLHGVDPHLTFETNKLFDQRRSFCLEQFLSRSDAHWRGAALHHVF